MMALDVIPYLLGAWALGFVASYKILSFKKFVEVTT